MSEERKIKSYDPMTGEPIYEEPEVVAAENQQQPQPQITGYDPMTGQPIYANSQPQPQPQITGYDPMTGQPIYAGAPQPTPAMNAEPKPTKKKGKKIAAIIGGIVAAVLVIAMIVTAATQLVLGKSGKILVAAGNTCQDIPLVEALNLHKFVSGEKCTVEVEADVEGARVEAELSQDRKAKQFSMSGDVRYNGVGSNFLIYMDSEEIRFQAKDLFEEVLFYNYQQEPTGYFAQMMQSEGLDISQINQALQQAMNQEELEETRKESLQLIYDMLDALEFEKIDSDKFEVNGKDRNCKGYTTEIDRYVLLDWIDAYEDWFADYMGDYAETLRQYDVDYTEMFDEMRDEVSDIDPYELDIYIYRKQIAAVEMRSPRTNGSVVLEIQGGDYPLQNWELSTRGMDEKIKISQKGKSDKNGEEIRWSYNGEQIGELEYDKKTGDLEFAIKAYGENLFYIKGGLEATKTGFECVLDEMQIEGESIAAQGSLKVSNTADIKTTDAEEEFDIGNATEQMWMELVMGSRLSTMF